MDLMDVVASWQQRRMVLAVATQGLVAGVR
jgi:hypothetical protein